MQLQYKKFLLPIVIGIFSIIVISGCNNNVSAEPATIESVAIKTITALKNKDLEQLSLITHPSQGVVFSPYGYINQDSSITLSTDELSNLDLNQNFTWGTYDGIGTPINLSVQQYWEQFIYDRDYLMAPQVAQNQTLGTGNSLINIDTVFPTGTFIEYYFPGEDPQL